MSATHATTSAHIMVGSIESRVSNLAATMHDELRERVAGLGIDDHDVREDVFLSLVDHVEESLFLLLDREGAGGWSDDRLLDEAVRRAPRLSDPALLAEYARVSEWFCPTEAHLSHRVSTRFPGRSAQGLGHALIQNAAPSDLITRHAVMLAWTQGGTQTLRPSEWRELFARVGFVRDNRSEPRPDEVPTLYRAAVSGAKNGWSWTSSLPFAQYIARITGAQDIWVMETVSPDAVLARYDSRGEAEWVVDVPRAGAAPIRLMERRGSLWSLVDAQSAPKPSKAALKKAAQRARRAGNGA